MDMLQNEELNFRYRHSYKKAKLKTIVSENYNDPFLVFGDFFSIADIEYHLLTLKKLYRYAISLRCHKKNPSDIMWYTEMFGNVLNAAWVIHKTGIETAHLKLPNTYCKIRTGGELSRKILEKALNEIEINNPYFGIERSFLDFKLNTYHKILNEWLKLSFCSGDFIPEDKEQRQLYKNIRKIFICFWIIYERGICNNLTVQKNNGN